MIGFNRQNDKFGYLNNSYLCDFTIDNIDYTSAEQAVQHMKAVLFNDNESAENILNTDSCYEIKHQLSKNIKNFNPKVWKDNRVKIYTKVLTEKFKQNEDLRDLLVSTEDEVIVYCNPHDRIWGIGFSVNDIEYLRSYKDKWGSNLLGKVLMKVRDKI